MTSHRNSVATIVVAAAVTAGLIFGIAKFQKLMRQTFMLTAADPSLLNPVLSSSMEPISATLRTLRVRDIDKVIPGEQSLTIKAPAAFFTNIATSSDPKKEEQSITISFWSKGGDPVSVTKIDAVKSGCKLTGVDDQCGRNPYAERMQNGEWIVEIELFGVRSTDALRQQQVNYWIESANKAGSKCKVSFDDALRLRVHETDPAYYPKNTSENWGFCGTGFQMGTIARRKNSISGFVTAKHFFKILDGGQIEFNVQCGTYLPGNSCFLGFSIDGWSARIAVPVRKQAEWMMTYQKARSFLEEHVVRQQ